MVAEMVFVLDEMAHLRYETLEKPELSTNPHL